jgi:HSP20 family protein
MTSQYWHGICNIISERKDQEGGSKMSIIKYRPRTLDLFNWDGIMDRFFDDFEGGLRTPAVDVREDDEAYHVEVELPGLSEKDVEVKVENHVMSISSRKEESKEEKKEGYLRKERRHFSFNRSFTLPEHVDVQKIGASFKNGLLDISVPKAPAAKPKLIEVKTK